MGSQAGAEFDATPATKTFLSTYSVPGASLALQVSEIQSLRSSFC